MIPPKIPTLPSNAPPLPAPAVDPEFAGQEGAPPRKMARSQMRSWAKQQGARQQGLCPLCLRPLDFASKAAVVIDHNHDSGLIRGVLCRGCNGMEGKVAAAVGRWGGVGMDYTRIVPMLQRLVQYLLKPPINIVYPLHKTPEQKRVTRNAKVRKQRADARAAKAVKEAHARLE